ncbi:hypothetical protein ACFSTD_11890 [Novosphingobium colocasiae]
MTSSYRLLALRGAALLAIAPGMAQAATPVCLTRTEATGLVAYSLPQVIRGSGKRCQTTLPAGSFLPANAGSMAQRYETQKAGYWPQAKQAFLKVGSARDPGMAQVFRQMPDDLAAEAARRCSGRDRGPGDPADIVQHHRYRREPAGTAAARKSRRGHRAGHGSRQEGRTRQGRGRHHHLQGLTWR